MVGSFPIYGLRSAEVMENFSVIDATNLFRKHGSQLTQELVIVSNDGYGNPIGIARDGRIWISDHDTGQDAMIAASFEDFLVNILDGRPFG
jgi:hypothetical protein